MPAFHARGAQLSAPPLTARLVPERVDGDPDDATLGDLRLAGLVAYTVAGSHRIRAVESPFDPNPSGGAFTIRLAEGAARLWTADGAEPLEIGQRDEMFHCRPRGTRGVPRLCGCVRAQDGAAIEGPAVYVFASPGGVPLKAYVFAPTARRPASVGRRLSSSTAAAGVKANRSGRSRARVTLPRVG